jgi:hypothetical protein
LFGDPRDLLVVACLNLFTIFSEDQNSNIRSDTPTLMLQLLDANELKLLSALWLLMCSCAHAIAAPLIPPPPNFGRLFRKAAIHYIAFPPSHEHDHFNTMRQHPRNSRALR